MNIVGQGGGKKNTTSSNTRGDYQLNAKASTTIFNHFGMPTCDLFATGINCQVPPYFSTTKDSKINNVFNTVWTTSKLGCLPYANPPLELIPQVLEKVQTDRVPQLLLICPSLTQEIKNLSISPPIVIIHEKDTQLPSHSQTGGNTRLPQGPCSFAVLISGSPAPAREIIPALDLRLSKMAFNLTVAEGVGTNLDTVALVDSGAQVNMVSRSVVEQQGWNVRRGAAIKLKNANGGQSWSRQRVQLTIYRGTYSRQVEFIVGDIVQPMILGTPWIASIQIAQLQPQFGKLLFRQDKETHLWWTAAQTARIHTSEVNIVEVDAFEAFCERNEDAEAFCIFNLDAMGINEPIKHNDPQVQEVLNRYAKVFEEPYSRMLMFPRLEGSAD